MTNRYVKRFSTSLITREMQIKTTVRYHLALVKMSIIKQTKISVVEDVEKREHLCTAGGNTDWCGRCGKEYGASSKN